MAETKTFVGKIIVLGGPKQKRTLNRHVLKLETFNMSRSFEQACRWGIGRNKIILKEDNETVEIQINKKDYHYAPLREEVKWEDLSIKDIIRLSEKISHWDQDVLWDTHIEIEGGNYEEYNN